MLQKRYQRQTPTVWTVGACVEDASAQRGSSSLSAGPCLASSLKDPGANHGLRLYHLHQQHATTVLSPGYLAQKKTSARHPKNADDILLQPNPKPGLWLAGLSATFQNVGRLILKNTRPKTSFEHLPLQRWRWMALHPKFHKPGVHGAAKRRGIVATHWKIAPQGQRSALRYASRGALLSSAGPLFLSSFSCAMSLRALHGCHFMVVALTPGDDFGYLCLRLSPLSPSLSIIHYLSISERGSR